MTGVQTCALPIYAAAAGALRGSYPGPMLGAGEVGPAARDGVEAFQAADEVEGGDFIFYQSVARSMHPLKSPKLSTKGWTVFAG